MPSSSNTAFQISAIPAGPWSPLILTRDSDIFWCKDLSENAFLFALDNAPYILYETQDIPAHPVDVAFTFLPSPDALFLITTLTCYSVPIAEWLSNAITAHYRFSSELGMRVRTALHEAIANAVVHGNLGVYKQFQCIETFDAYCSQIQLRLNQTQYSMTRIAISMVRRTDSITLCVSDEGDGYQHYRDSSYSEPACSLPGLTIIHGESSAVRVLNGGRTIEMDFAV